MQLSSASWTPSTSTTKRSSRHISSDSIGGQMQITDELIRGVVEEVLSNMRNGQAVPKQVVAPAVIAPAVIAPAVIAPAINGHAEASIPGEWGVFDDVSAAVAAAAKAQKAFDSMGIAGRK